MILGNKKQQARGVDLWIYQNLWGSITSILYNWFHSLEAEGLLPNSFYEASITLTPKPKMSQEKKIKDENLSWTQMQKSLKD